MMTTTEKKKTQLLFNRFRIVSIYSSSAFFVGGVLRKKN